jgi:hypothetical protein
MQVYFNLGTCLICHRTYSLQSTNDLVLLLGRPTIPQVYLETLGVTSHLSCGRAAALAILKMDDMADPCKSSCLGEPRLDVRRQIDRNSAFLTSCIRLHPRDPTCSV